MPESKKSQIATPSSDFYGRDSELAKFREAHADVAAGRGRVILVEGEAGIGKTRLVEEASLVAKNDGFTVLKGRCFEGNGVPPIWPWVEFLRESAAKIGWPAIRDLFGNQAYWLSSVLPEMSPDSEPQGQEEGISVAGGDTPTLVFDFTFRILRLFDLIAEESPVFLVLEDVQWADEMSLEVLKTLARNVESSRVMLVITHRLSVSDGGSIETVLGDFYRITGFLRVSLKGLNKDDVSKCIEHIVKRSIDIQASQRVHELTDGNPFYVRQVITAIPYSPTLDVIDVRHIDNLGVPDGITRLVEREVSRLNAGDRLFLEYASLIGQEFSLEYLIGLPEFQDTESILQCADRATIAGIIEPITGESGRYRFDHDLVKTAIAGSIPSGSKMSMHAHLAMSLERRWGKQDDRHAAEILHHLLEADVLGSADDTARYALRAGKYLFNAMAFGASARCLEKGLAACAAGGAKEFKPELHEALGQLKFCRDPNYFEAHDQFSYAIDEYEKRRNHKAIAGLALNPFLFLLSQVSFEDKSLVIDRIAAYVVPNTKEALHAQALKGLYALNSDFDDKPNRDLLSEVLEQARKHKYIELQKQLHHMWAHALDYAGEFEAALFHYESLSKLCPPDDFRDSHLNVVHAAVRSAECLCYLNRNEEAAVILRQIARSPALKNRPHLVVQVQIADALGPEASLQNLEDQLQKLRATEELVQSIDLNPTYTHLGMATNAFHRGAIDEMHRLLDPIAASILDGLWAHLFPNIAAKYILLTGDLRWKDALIYTCTRFLESPMSIARGRMANIWHAGLAAAAVFEGDIGYARRLYNGLNPEQMDNGFLDAGLLAWKLGDLDAAIYHLSAASDQPGNWSVWSKLRLGQLLLEKGGTGETEQATNVLEEALKMAEETGMSSVADEARTALGRTTSKSPFKNLPDSNLTPRELDILRLFAAGKADKEIAAELYISPSTVSNHARNIFRKLGVGNRTEAALYAVDHGLMQGNISRN